MNHFITKLLAGCLFVTCLIYFSYVLLEVDQPDLGRVAGVVTLDGEPLAGAIIYFLPVEGGRSSIGTTDEHGVYELQYLRESRGARLGRHLVRISTFFEPVQNDQGKIEQSGREELVPARYNQNSELEVEVEAGSNTFDFELTTP